MRRRRRRKPAPADARHGRARSCPTTVLLFRYSALTFNGHRIHYDRRYVTEVEGYPGLVVHGPLIATLLLDLLRRDLPDATVARFAFRAVQPALRHCAVLGLRPPRTDGETVRLWARDADGALAMDATRDPRLNLDIRRRFHVERSPTSTRTSATPCAQLCAPVPRRILPQGRRAERPIPEEFVDALTKAGWLAAMIPQEYGGSGLGLTEASVIMEEINRAGGNSGACHGQMYNMGTLLRHGTEAQKAAVPAEDRQPASCACSRWRVTEPTTGTDTTKIKTTAVKKGDRYVVNGQKVWISRVQHSDLMILLARTTPLAEVKKKSEGMSIFIVDLRDGDRPGPDRAADPEHGQPRDQRALLRQPRDPRREPDRRGRARASSTSSTGSTPSAR